MLWFWSVVFCLVVYLYGFQKCENFRSRPAPSFSDEGTEIQKIHTTEIHITGHLESKDQNLVLLLSLLHGCVLPEEEGSVEKGASISLEHQCA